MDPWNPLIAEQPKPEHRNVVADVWWFDWLICLAVGVILAFAAGCDLEGAQAAHESVMDAQFKKEQLPPEARVNSRLLSIPVGGTWIEQSGNDHRGRQMKPFRRYTQSADLTERK